MRNYNTKSMKQPRQRPEEMAVIRQGYLDAVAGKGFHPAYETMPRWRQGNYEMGRLVAVELRAKPPAWPSGTILPRWMETTASMIQTEMRARPEEG